MDLVIPYRKETTHNAIELHYCIKSFRKFFDINTVFIIGSKSTEWATHVNCIEGTHKQTNIIRKIKLACALEEISDPFICTSDDVFMLKQTYIKYWHCGLLEGMEAMPQYRRYNQNSMDKGCVYNFDNHAPIIYEKQKFLDRVKEGDYLIQSQYAKDEIGEYLPRLLFNSAMSEKQIYNSIEGQVRFSTGSNGVSSMKNVFKQLYD